jgi:hypothetical protein
MPVAAADEIAAALTALGQYQAGAISSAQWMAYFRTLSPTAQNYL